MSRRLVLGIAGFAAGCSCQPGLPDVPVDDPPVEPDSDPPRADSADSALPPCQHPEQEPNDDPAGAEDLGTDVLGCGTFGAVDDADLWDFTLGEDAWLAVDVTAFSLGSAARLAVTLVSADLDEAHTIARAGDLPEVHLVFPAPPSSWRAIVRQSRERERGAGEDYFYEVRASSTKPPVDWDVDERAAHGPEAPQLLADADADDVAVAVFGTIATPADADWYEVTFPSQGYVVTFDVDAAPHGSAGNYSLRVVDETGAERVVGSDPDAPGPDPRYTRETTGPGAVRVQVFEANGGAGRPYWYRLAATVEVP